MSLVLADNSRSFSDMHKQMRTVMVMLMVMHKLQDS